MEIATLIEGPTDAHIIQDIPGVTGGVAHDDCAISGETAICTLVLSAQGTATTMGIQTEAVSALAIQVATAATSSAGTSGLSVTTSATVSPTSQNTSSGATATQTSTSGGGRSTGLALVRWIFFSVAFGWVI